MAAWHLEIHSAQGRTLCQVNVDTRRVGNIDAVKSGDTLGILLDGETAAVGYPTVAEVKEGGFTLNRWPLDDRGKDPIVTQIS